MKNFAKKLSFILFLSLPAVIFFSYHPMISFGSNNYMNYDLSLVEVWLVLFFLISLPRLKSVFLVFGWKKLLLASLIPAYCSLSAIWSPNHLRAVLTSGLLWLIVFAVLNIILILKERSSLRQDFLKMLLFSAVFISVVCFLQCILDLSGASRDFTLLCAGCSFTAFGFPHPNGFAIEPQFMGNLLLVPTLFSYFLIFAHAYKNHKQKIGFVLLAGFLSFTIFLTLSRGAIYSLTIGLISLFALCATKRFPIIKYKLKTASIALVVLLCSFLIALATEGVFSMVSPTSDTFISGVSKAVHQLSLGVVDFRPADYKDSADQSDNLAESKPEDSSNQEALPDASLVDDSTSNVSETDNTSSFSGYVAESTNVRLDLSGLALDTWASSPQYLVIGSGLGSAGIVINQAHPDKFGPKEIVQNEYFSLLLELGIVGVILIVAVALFALRKVPKNPLFIAILLSFAFSLLFFSGLPNALHIYLLPVVFATKDNLFIEHKIKNHRHKRH